MVYDVESKLNNQGEPVRFVNVEYELPTSAISTKMESIVPEPVKVKVIVFRPVTDSSSPGPFEKTILIADVLDG